MGRAEPDVGEGVCMSGQTEGKSQTSPPQTCRFYVDEAGDMTLFDKRGRVLVGTGLVSRFFMVGLVEMPDPERAQSELATLRSRLLSEPYFHDVPSMQVLNRKTALKFHAKDDLPEVRREVFAMLPRLTCKVQIAIRRKDVLARQAQALFQYRGTKLSADDIYDDLISRLFRNILHKADENRIVFARRGKNDRMKALNKAIGHAKQKFAARWGVNHDKPTTIASGYPHEHAGLQVVDYYLWAVQRLFERGEDRFFRAVQEDCRLIMDLDDTRRKPYGEWYSKSNPLTAEKIKRPSKD